MTLKRFSTDSSVIAMWEIMKKKYPNFADDSLRTELAARIARTDFQGLVQTRAEFQIYIDTGRVIKFTLFKETDVVNLCSRLKAVVFGLLPFSENVDDSELTELEFDFMFTRALQIVKEPNTLAVA